MFILRTLIGSLTACVFAQGASAQQIAPLIYELTPTGANASEQLQIENDGASPIAFEVLATRRSYSETGQLQAKSAQQDFAIAPDLVWLEPGTNRTVSVRYIGDPHIGQSAMYAITFRQAPVQLLVGDDPSGVNLQMEFHTIAHVVPEGAMPQVAISVLQTHNNEVAVEFQNSGSKHARIDEQPLELTTTGAHISIGRQELAERFAAVWLLPQGRRLLRIPLPGLRAGDAISAVWGPVVTNSTN